MILLDFNVSIIHIAQLYLVTTKTKITGISFKALNKIVFEVFLSVV